MQDDEHYAERSDYNPFKRNFNCRLHRAEMDRHEAGEDRYKINAILIYPQIVRCRLLKSITHPF